MCILKQPSASVNPENQLSFNENLGLEDIKIILSDNLKFNQSNFLKFLLLKTSIILFNCSFRLFKIIFPFNNKIIKYISKLFLIINLEYPLNCLTKPKPKISLIWYNTKESF